MGTPIQTAMVLAAGHGTRMRPLTDALPKPLVRLAGRPLVDHVLDRIAAIGVTRVVVNVHYLADQMEAHVVTRERPRIVISDERDRLLDTGGGLVKALPLLGAAPFLVHNSDSVWREDGRSNLAELVAAWDERRMDCLLMLAPTMAALGYRGRGDFALDTDGRVRRPLAGETAPFVYTGVQIVHPRVFEGAPVGPFSMNRSWDRAIGAGRVAAYVMTGIWMHVGSPAELAEAETAMAGSSHGHR